MTDLRTGAALLALLLGALTGCTATLQTSVLPEGYAVRNLAKVDAGTPFALNGTGSVAAVTEGITRVTPLSGALGQSLAPAPATSLNFSPGGERLAAAFAASNQSVLNLFDLRGKLLAEAIIPGRVTSIVWRSEKELLVTALLVRRYSFGSELIGSLYRWDGAAPPVATILSDETVRPMVAKLPDEVLIGSLCMALSPYGDEIAYSALKDPPLFTPYLRTVVMHLASGATRQVAETGLSSGGPLYAADGESLLVGDAGSLTRRMSLPDGKEIYAWPAPGDHKALSPSGAYLLLDNHLYQEGRDIASFPKDATGAFLPDGSGMVISSGGTLFLVTGLNDGRPPALPKDLERLLELRRLRMKGLITAQEFKARRAKASAP